MKKLVLAVSVLSVMMYLSGCSTEDPGSQIITERIQYDVIVNSENEDLGWWVNNIEGSKREPFLDWLMDAAYSGEYQAWDYFHNPLSSDQLMAVGVDSVYMTLRRETPPYAEFDTLVITRYDPQDVRKVRFLEEWRYAPGDGPMEKKVIGMAPVLVRKVGGEEYNQVLFWIYFDERYPEIMK